MNTRPLLAIAVILAGCALTPAQVVESSPKYVVPLTAPTESVARCFMEAAPEQFAGFIPVRQPVSGRILLLRHIDNDAGVVIDFAADRATIHISPMIFTKDRLAAGVENVLKACP